MQMRWAISPSSRLPVDFGRREAAAGCVPRTRGSEQGTLSDARSALSSGPGTDGQAPRRALPYSRGVVAWEVGAAYWPVRVKLDLKMNLVHCVIRHVRWYHHLGADALADAELVHFEHACVKAAFASAIVSL